MLPNEQVPFTELVDELFAAFGRNAGPQAQKAWWIALKSRALSDVSRVIRHLIEESDNLPTPARVIGALRDEKPRHTQEGPRLLCEPSKTTLLGARRLMDMHGETAAREAYGDYAVNVIKNNPRTGYTAIDARTYGGELPEHIRLDLQSGARHNYEVPGRRPMAAFIPVRRNGQ